MSMHEREKRVRSIQLSFLGKTQLSVNSEQQHSLGSESPVVSLPPRAAHLLLPPKAVQRFSPHNLTHNYITCTQLLYRDRPIRTQLVCIDNNPTNLFNPAIKVAIKLCEQRHKLQNKEHRNITHWCSLLGVVAGGGGVLLQFDRIRLRSAM